VDLSCWIHQTAGMGKIGSIGNLENYLIGFCNLYININNYHISFLKMLPFVLSALKNKNTHYKNAIKFLSLSISYNFSAK